MNVFVTDHPMVSQPPRSHPRLRRWLLRAMLVYPIWLLLLGPFWALDGRGAMDLIPLSLRRMIYLPATPFFYCDSLFPTFEAYVNWWYQNPNAAETTR